MNNNINKNIIIKMFEEVKMIEGCFLLGIVIMLIKTSVSDLKKQTIYNEDLIFLFWYFNFYFLLVPSTISGWDRVIGVIVSGVISLILYMFYLGGGDVKLFVVLGFLFGYKIVWVIYLSFLFSVIFIFVEMIRQKSFSLKMTIPLAPAISLATLYMILKGGIL